MASHLPFDYCRDDLGMGQSDAALLGMVFD